MKLFCYPILLFVIVFVIPISAQQNLWKVTNESSVSKQSDTRYTKPTSYKVFRFDFDNFTSNLSALGRSENKVFQLGFPLPDGRLEDFELWETPVFDEALMAKYPGFTSFTGKGIQTPTAILKMSYSPFGIHVMIMDPSWNTVYIDPYTLHNKTAYIVYHKKDLIKKSGKFMCSVSLDDANHSKVLPPNNTHLSSGARAGDCTLRSYRLALACTGEYAKFHGGTKEKVLAAYNASMTRVNGLYERDLAITMKLIANTDLLIYLVGNSDPYSNTNGEAMLGENQRNIDNVIGFSNYDIGHVFSTGGGGIAQLNAPCSSSKAEGVTGSSAPIGDAFDIDYVAHEMGHQFGADHTQNNDCQKNNATAVEPGSGSTIMGYAGICDPNVQNNSDDHFHAVSIGEISRYVTLGQGNTCAVRTDIDNTPPTVSNIKSTYTIPVTTSFVLTAIGNDADNDAITYCWEQMDNEDTTSPPKATNTAGPAFRSLSPTTSPQRFFPDLQRRYVQWEVLPSVVRNMNFRCTVRDNNAVGGCTAETNVKVNTVSSAGPFIVTFPNAATVNWLVGSKQTVTWDVAKTDLAPINCSLVNILLSTDGGKTYPQTLATQVPNTGSFLVETPNTPSNTAKVMVVAFDNIFFDVSNANFKITTSFTMKSDITKFDICNQNEVSSTITLTRVQDISQSVFLDIENPPSNLQYTFFTNPLNVPGNTQLTLSNLQGLPFGLHKVKVTGSNSNNEKLSADIELFKGSKISETPNLLNPINFSSNVNPVNVSFEWQEIAGAKDYTIEISTSPSFVPLVITSMATSNSYKTNLANNKVFYWRVKANSPCVTNGFSAYHSFKTSDSNANQPALLLKNELLVVDAGQVGLINQDKINISTQDPNATLLTITKLPNNGSLKVGNIVLNLGDVVKFSEIIANNFSYTHVGNNTENDVFNFDILDDSNRWLPNNTFNIKIRQLSLGVAAFQEKGLLCFGDVDAIIRVDAFGGTPPYTYSLDNSNYQNSNRFTNLTSGTYIIYVKDATGVINASNSLKLEAPSNLTVTSSLVNYDININASGGTGILSYSLDDIIYNTTPNFLDPGNGVYTVFVKDENGCKTSNQLTINIPPLEGNSLLSNDVKCFGQKATIVTTALGGIPPYTFSTNGTNYQASPSFTLNAGKYGISIKDAGNKVYLVDSISTAKPEAIVITLVQNKFDITINVAGGTGSFEYSADGNTYSTNNIITLPGNGTYKLYVRDENQCTKTANISLNVLSNANETIQQITCFGKNDGYIKLLAANGTPPIMYSLNDSPLGSTREWSDLGPGDYVYKLKDAKNDSIVRSITISEPPLLLVDLQISEDDLTILASGGTPPYSYSINGGSTYLLGNVFLDLPAKKYDLAIKDKNGCLANASVTISSDSDTSTDQTLHLYPNPSSDFIQIKSDLLHLSTTKISLTNNIGQSIDLNGKMIINIGEATLNIDDLPKGAYVITLKSNASQQSKLFIKY